MRLDEVTAEIRPRSDWEAVDLGFAMVRRDFWRCLTAWWMAVLIPTAAATFLLWEQPILLLALFWWWKPAGSRIVLYQLSRRLFGEQPGWRTIWREIPRAWTRRFFYRFVWARFSPWLPVTLAVEDLEGLRGKKYQQRCGQVVRRGEGVVLWIFFLADMAAAWFGMGLLVLVLTFVPEGQDGPWQNATQSWDPEQPFEIPLLVSRMVVGCLMVTISLVDLFVIGAGFGVYVNNRTWIEGWDVELAFRRLAQRLGKIAAAVLMMIFVSTQVSRGFESELPYPDETAVRVEPGAEPRQPSEVIYEVKSDAAFKVHTIKEKVQEPSKSHWKLPTWLGGFAEILGTVFVVSAIGLLVILIAWVISKMRFSWKLGGGGDSKPLPGPSARVVMGMDVSPDSLPADIPGRAWLLWQQGSLQEALGLLYRGSISRMMEWNRIEIQESDTEGDCMRRVESAGAAAHPDYFRGITGAWIRLAYAGHRPADAEVEALCKQWPFAERRSR